MRVLIALVAFGLVSGCAFTVGQQSKLVARQLAIPYGEVESTVRETSERHSMKVAWVRTTSDAAFEVGLKRNLNLGVGGIILVFRRRDGRWVEDVRSQRSWEGDSSRPEPPIPTS